MDQNRLNGIYTVQGVLNRKRAIIKPLGTIDLKKEPIRDTRIKRFELKKNLIADVFACNISDTHLMSTKKLPILCTVISFEKSIRKIPLVKMYLYFTITSKIKSGKQLFKKQLKGDFNLELKLGDSIMKLDEEFKNYPGNSEIVKWMEKYVRNEEMINMFDELIEIEQNKLRKEYGSIFENLKPIEPTISFRNC